MFKDNRYFRLIFPWLSDAGFTHRILFKAFFLTSFNRFALFLRHESPKFQQSIMRMLKFSSAVYKRKKKHIDSHHVLLNLKKENKTPNLTEIHTTSAFFHSYLRPVHSQAGIPFTD